MVREVTCNAHDRVAAAAVVVAAAAAAAAVVVVVVFVVVVGRGSLQNFLIPEGSVIPSSSILAFDHMIFPGGRAHNTALLPIHNELAFSYKVLLQHPCVPAALSLHTDTRKCTQYTHARTHRSP